MSVVSAELWVGTIEGWVSRGLWLLDTRLHAGNQHEAQIFRILGGCRIVPVAVGFLAVGELAFCPRRGSGTNFLPLVML